MNKSEQQKSTQQKCIKSIIESGELDLGFCKIVKKEIKGGKGELRGKAFKRKPFYKLGVTMTRKFRKILNG